MKILQFADLFFPSFGGIATRIYKNSLGKINQHFLYVPYPKKITALKYKNKYENIKVHCYVLYNEFKIGNNLINFLLNHNISINFNSRKLLNCVNKNDFDVVHGHALWYLLQQE